MTADPNVGELRISVFLCASSAHCCWRDTAELLLFHFLYFYQGFFYFSVFFYPLFGWREGSAHVTEGPKWTVNGWYCNKDFYIKVLQCHAFQFRLPLCVYVKDYSKFQTREEEEADLSSDASNILKSATCWERKCSMWFTPLFIEMVMWLK